MRSTLYALALLATPAAAADLPMTYAPASTPARYERCGFDVMTRTWGTACEGKHETGPKSTPIGTVTRTPPTPPSPPDNCGPKDHPSADKGHGPRGDHGHGRGHGGHGKRR